MNVIGISIHSVCKPHDAQFVISAEVSNGHTNLYIGISTAAVQHGAMPTLIATVSSWKTGLRQIRFLRFTMQNSLTHSIAHGRMNVITRTLPSFPYRSPTEVKNLSLIQSQIFSIVQLVLRLTQLSRLVKFLSGDGSILRRRIGWDSPMTWTQL